MVNDRLCSDLSLYIYNIQCKIITEGNSLKYLSTKGTLLLEFLELLFYLCKVAINCKNKYEIKKSH